MTWAQKQKNSTGFTIVELLIVVVVIAILAAITIVAYNGIQRQTVASILQNTARDIGKAMELSKATTGTYPTSIPSNVSLAPGVGVALTVVADSTEFCINVTTIRYDNLFYSINDKQSVNPNLCSGAVVTMVGDYNSSAGGVIADSWPTQSSVGTVVAPGDMNFTITTDETWSQAIFTWNSMPGATQYRINQSDAAVGTWYVRSPSSTTLYAWDAGSYSGNIQSSITSLTWTKNIPTALDQIYQYRIQYKKSDGSWSDWQTLTLNPMAGRTSPTIRNFTVTPTTNWSSITLSWDSIGNFAKLPNVKIRINQRNSSTATWYARSSSSNTNYAWDTTSYSGAINPTFTSQTWSANIPPDAASIYEYRIQVYSGTYTSDWVYFTLDPLQAGALPQITNFTVVPNGAWSSIVLSWDSIGDFANLPNTKIRLNQRNSPTGTWYSRSSSSNMNYAWNTSSYSGGLNPTTTTQTWTANIPSAGATYEYRIQVYSGTATSGWTTFSLTH